MQSHAYVHTKKCCKCYKAIIYKGREQVGLMYDWDLADIHERAGKRLTDLYAEEGLQKVKIITFKRLRLCAGPQNRPIVDPLRRCIFACTDGAN